MLDDTMAEKRKRADSKVDGDIGQERYALYKAAFERIAQAIAEGYYLEAISIEESLIADRLESHLSYRLGKDFGFKNLGKLIDKIKSDETDAELRKLVSQELDQWRKARNTAAHEMVKIEVGKQVSWEARSQINQSVAEAGLILVRKIDQRTRKLRS
jgi:hypothetical protein